MTIGKWFLEKLGLSNTTMAIFAGFTCIIEFSMLSFTHSVLMLYVSTLIGSFSTLLYALCQSFISSILSENDHGKAYSLYFCFESFANIVGPTVYIIIYKSSFKFYSGIVFIVFALVYTSVLLGGAYLKFAGNLDLRDNHSTSDNTAIKDDDVDDNHHDS